MPRFNMMDRLLHDSRFEDFLASWTGGSSDHDHLNGTTSGNVLFAGGSNDTVAGMAGNDMLDRGTGDDKVWGGSGNDRLSGGNGSDILVRGLGSRQMDRRRGHQTLLQPPNDR